MSDPLRRWVSTGFTQHSRGDIDRVPDFDPRTGEHLWTIVTMYRIDPTKMSDPTHTPLLDNETLLTVAGPVCFYCEQAYTPRLLRRRCKGRP